MSHPDPIVHEYHIKANDTFPNSPFPALLYKRVLEVPAFFAASKIEKHFTSHGWTNIKPTVLQTRHHYHPSAHKVLAAIKGQVMILLGGENGKIIKFEKGDLLIIPAGVAHKNLSKEADIQLVTAYYGADEIDTLFGDEGEGKKTSEPIGVPPADPFYGDHDNGLVHAWKDRV